MEIKIYEGDYDRKEFYSKMGKFFAEPKYKKQLEYLKNEDNQVWFLVEENGEVIAFTSIRKEKTKTVLSTSFVEEKYRGKGLYKKLIKRAMGHSVFPFVTTTNNERIRNHLEKLGFYVERETKNYFFMRKDD